MPLTTAGRNHFAKTLTNQSGVLFFDNANATIGIGDDTTAFSTSQTNLQAGTNKVRSGMDTGFPSVTDNVMTFRATFGTAEANFDWNEWGVFNHITDGAGVMLQRKVEPLGTKTNAQSWEITVDIEIQIGN